MSKKSFFPVLMCSVFIGFMGSPSFALQSGGVEIGDLESGSVVGQPFKSLEVDIDLHAICVGGLKTWSSSTPTLVLADPLQKAILIKVTNHFSLAQGIRILGDQTFAGPNSLSVGTIVDPGESKYIGIPIIDLISDLTFVTGSRMISYVSHTDSKMLGGKIALTK